MARRSNVPTARQTLAAVETWMRMAAFLESAILPTSPWAGSLRGGLLRPE
jgi:hypothetical protein